MAADRRFSILMLASEAVPFAKTGGLGDVAGALTTALARLGHKVRLVLPRYRGIAGGEEVERFPVTVGVVTLEARFFRHALEGEAEAVLVDCPPLYDREALYGHGNRDYLDNSLRFAFLTRAAFEFTRRVGDRPDIVHAHDWQTGLAAPYLRTIYAHDEKLGGVPVVFTIHNMAYQGLFPPVNVPALDLPWDFYRIDGFEYWGQLSFLKAGIVFSDILTTVSRRYAREIQTPEYGFGFEGIVRERARSLFGITNGIDTDAWNPLTDPHLPVPFGPGDLAGKLEAKRALLEAFSLPSDAAALSRPLVAIVSRMVDQKGFDLLAEAEDALVKTGASFLMLGTGEERYERRWMDLATRHPEQVGVRIEFDNRLAHLVEGGADIFLMPSRFEPCGLNQMYSMRYGTVPVVRATGGLDDTVEQWSKSGKGTGFKFRPYTADAMMKALRAALAVFRQPKAWRKLQQAGMNRDFSWNTSAARYAALYGRAVRGGRARAGTLKPPARA